MNATIVCFALAFILAGFVIGYSVAECILKKWYNRELDKIYRRKAEQEVTE